MSNEVEALVLRIQMLEAEVANINVLMPEVLTMKGDLTKLLTAIEANSAITNEMIAVYKDAKSTIRVLGTVQKIAAWFISISAGVALFYAALRYKG